MQCGGLPPPYVAKLQIFAADRVHFVGDSITLNSWFTPLQNAINAGLPNPIVASASGVAGNVIADIAGDVPGRITSFNPTVVIIECGVNDVINGTVDATFQSTYQGVINAVLAFNPLIRIATVSILCDGELWQSGGGGPWGANSLDAGILAKNARIAALTNQIHFDVRTPAGAYEVANNRPEPGAVSGILTTDQIHPNATGRNVMRDACLARIAL